MEDSFTRLRTGVMRFMNENNFKNFVMIVRSAGFVQSAMIGSQNTLNFAYILYLTLREMKMPNADIERNVRRWFVMSVLTGRYSGSPESQFDFDIRQIQSIGIESYIDTVLRTELSEAFWEVGLPQAMVTSVASSPLFRTFQAAQVKLNDKGFLSRDIAVGVLVEVKSDIHHIFPRHYLKTHGLTKGQYNQIANYVVTQSEINIAISNKPPQQYFAELLDQCNGGSKHYGNLTDINELRENFRMNCIPDGIENMTVEDFPDFLTKRRVLMSNRIREYFERL